MSLFSGILSKIFGTAAPAVAIIKPAAAPAATPATPATTAASTPPPAVVVAPAAAAAPVVDVTAVLDALAAKSSEKLEWRKSIVDLMKLVGIDSGLSDRKELAKELHYSGDMSDSAAMNVWLHREVIKLLAANGGKVPAELLD